jgi:exopolysaccharide biosynthesis polyprenyl glycosylphosphotransferase
VDLPVIRVAARHRAAVDGMTLVAPALTCLIWRLVRRRGLRRVGPKDRVRARPTDEREVAADRIGRPAALDTVIRLAAPVSVRVLRRLARIGRLERIAVIGSVRTARALKRELELAGRVRSTVVGRIAIGGDGHPDPEVPVLGHLNELRPTVARNQIDLIVISGEASRARVFDHAIAAAADHVRVCEFADLYEAIFGHVPTAEINASWFEYLLHPCYGEAGRIKRGIDVVGASVAGIGLLPLIAVLALCVKRDRGPALFKQTRIGEGGRPITVYKLRTMRLGADSSVQWSSADDPRVTRIGRFLRRTHLDEVPQLLNVLRGEMSLVGPRPEQPEFVDRLEKTLPLYRPRHLIKPGITGWAQICCGYAGSDVGSAWKLCHDLFYMKHRSLRFDLVILGYTLRTLFFEHEFEVEPQSEAAFIAASAMPQTRRRRFPPAALKEMVPHAEPDVRMAPVG